ncbi:MAG: inorganic phosphate transporter [Arsenophonus sp.]|nr:MAG: inorganic phosphate transporter [Arsenophonus sp.]
MFHLFNELDFYTMFLLVLALLFSILYEVINGFHDTANAVATVIYTRAIKEKFAVFLSAIFNFFGVIFGGLSVAYTIVYLIPTNLLLNITSFYHKLAMIFSMLLSAIIWNLTTWYFGLPASSSHTLIGSIIGVCLSNALLRNTSILEALNIPKMTEICFSLFFSPPIGFLISGLLVFFLYLVKKKTIKKLNIHLTPYEQEKRYGKKNPPFWTRIALILSSIGVSFSHGSNDGQKGIGLIMLVLICLAPTGFLLNMNATNDDIVQTHNTIKYLQNYSKIHKEDILYLIKKNDKQNKFKVLNKEFYCDYMYPVDILNKTSLMLSSIKNYYSLNLEQRYQIRRSLICLSDFTLELTRIAEIKKSDILLLGRLRKNLLKTVEYAPLWIIVSIALAISIGTIFGWRRVSVTIGEKIGKKHMTYAQGLSAQLTAAICIFFASYTGMAVSTTQLLSSAVAGSMVFNGGLQNKTIKNILLAWLFTLPVSIILSGFFYWIALKCV